MSAQCPRPSISTVFRESTVLSSSLHRGALIALVAPFAASVDGVATGGAPSADASPSRAAPASSPVAAAPAATGTVTPQMLVDQRRRLSEMANKLHEALKNTRGRELSSASVAV